MDACSDQGGTRLPVLGKKCYCVRSSAINVLNTPIGYQYLKTAPGGQVRLGHIGFKGSFLVLELGCI